MRALWQATSPHFCAGAVEENGVIVAAAPRLSHLVGQPLWALDRFTRVHGGTLIAVAHLKESEP